MVIKLYSHDSRCPNCTMRKASFLIQGNYTQCVFARILHPVCKIGNNEKILVSCCTPAKRCSPAPVYAAGPLPIPKAYGRSTCDCTPPSRIPS